MQHLQARRWSWPAAQAVAAAATTAAFALSHLDAFTLSAVLRCTAWLLPGAALALAWAWRQRTWHCVLLHAAFNAALWASSTAPLARG